MQKRKFDELISYFNRKVAEMDIGTKYKMELLGMVTALGLAHEKETEERKTGEWIRKISVVDCATFVGDECSQCGYFKSMGQANFCPNCGADMRGGNHETP